MKEGRVIYGKLEINEKAYPFHMTGHVVTIVQTPYEYNNDFENIQQLEKVSGLTNDNKIITLMNCRFSDSAWRPLHKNIVFTVTWYAEFDKEATQFDKVSFRSDALNAFFPPRKAKEMGSIKEYEGNGGSFSVRIKPHEERTQSFSTNIEHQDIGVQLYYTWEVSSKLEDTKIGQIHTWCSFAFSNLHDIDCLGDCYLWLYDFLVFTSFRQNVVIEETTLHKKKEDGRLERVGSACFFTNHDGYVANAYRSITFDDIGSEVMGKLFADVAMRRKTSSYNTFYVPENNDWDKYVDSAKWLSTALSFEGEFDAKYPDYKYHADENFKAAKDTLLKCIEDEIGKSGKGINNRINSNYKRFKHLIATTDTALAEKFRFIFEHFGALVENVKKKYMTANRVTASDNELSERWAECRNNIAHGVIEPLIGIDIVNYSLTRMFIYILILEAAGIQEQRIKAIIEKIF